MIRLEVPRIDVSLGLVFDSRASERLAALLWETDALPGPRLPPVFLSNVAGAGESNDIAVRMQGDRMLLSYDGVQADIPHVADRGVADIAKVVASLAVVRALERSTVTTFHAAALMRGADAVLLVGASGAGKSSISFAALSAGRRIAGSDCAFVRGDTLVAANTRASAYTAALDRYGLEVAPGAVVRGETAFLNLGFGDFPLTITQVVFPRVLDGPLVVRRLNERRARMLLFENGISQLPLSHFLADEVTPTGLLPTGRQISAIATQVETLARLDPRIVEGRPREIVDYLSARSPGTT